MRIFGIFPFLFLFPGVLALYAQNYVPVTNVGGRAQLKDFINEQLVYPPGALKDGISGTVEIRFMVKSNGDVTNAVIAKSVSNEIDAEAMKIFNLILWEPAYYQSRPINDSSVFSIKFEAGKYAKLIRKRGYGNLPEPYTPVDNSYKIFKFTELDVPPNAIFDDPKANLGTIIYSNLKYPEEAIHQNISGKVKLSFIIETSGLSSNIRIENSLGAGCNEEAIRVLKLIKWKPGIKNHIAVRSSATLEIVFNLKEMESLQYVSPNLNSTF